MGVAAADAVSSPQGVSGAEHPCGRTGGSTQIQNKLTVQSESIKVKAKDAAPIRKPFGAGNKS